MHTLTATLSPAPRGQPPGVYLIRNNSIYDMRAPLQLSEKAVATGVKSNWFITDGNGNNRGVSVSLAVGVCVGLLNASVKIIAMGII